MSSSQRVSTSDARDAWQDVLSRAFQVFSYYHWYWLEIQYPQLGPDTHSITVKNAALESSLMSIRDLDDFFGSKGAQKDDVVCSDFGYASPGRFLSYDERDAINKKIAHLTYRAVHERRHQPVQYNPKTWNYSSLVLKTMDVFSAFVRFLESTFFQADPTQHKLIRPVLDTINATVANIQSIAAIEFNA